MDHISWQWKMFLYCFVEADKQKSFPIWRNVWLVFINQGRMITMLVVVEDSENGNSLTHRSLGDVVVILNV